MSSKEYWVLKSVYPNGDIEGVGGLSNGEEFEVIIGKDDAVRPISDASRSTPVVNGAAVEILKMARAYPLPRLLKVKDLEDVSDWEAYEVVKEGDSRRSRIRSKELGVELNVNEDFTNLYVSGCLLYSKGKYCEYGARAPGINKAICRILLRMVMRDAPRRRQ